MSGPHFATRGGNSKRPAASMASKKSLQLLLLLALSSLSSCNNVELLCRQCECITVTERRSATDVICERKALTKVPAGSIWPLDARRMKLGYNIIHSIDVLESSNITELDLHRNTLQQIAPGAFETFPYLEVLDISHNMLSTLHMDTFRGLSRLKVLNMSYNSVRAPPAEIFFPLTSLQVLRLGHNPLRYIEKTWFSKIPDLTSFDMSGVDAHSLPDGVFHLVPQLAHVDLSANEFDDVPTALRSAERLTVLDMSDNPIVALTSSSFRKLEYLEELYVMNMQQLEVVDGGTFVTQTRLKVLHLHNNPKLSEIDVEAFREFWAVVLEERGNWTIKELLLNDNNLEHLHEEAVPWDKVDLLNLQGNPWACECSNAWMRNVHFQDELTVRLRCGSPPQYEEKPLLEVPESLFTCHDIPHLDHHERNLHAALVTLLVLTAALAVAVLAFIIRKRYYQGRLWGRRGLNGSVYYVKARTNPIDAADGHV